VTHCARRQTRPDRGIDEPAHVARLVLKLPGLLI
jgi:hypothetical protein